VVVDAADMAMEDAVSAVLTFIEQTEVGVLNVAEPRASAWGDGYRFSFDVMTSLRTRKLA
jgi:hypothetical protein